MCVSQLTHVPHHIHRRYIALPCRRHRHRRLNKLRHPPLHILILQIIPILNLRIITTTQHIPTERRWRVVITIQRHLAPHARRRTEAGRGRPVELHLFCLYAPCVVLVVDASEEECVEADFGGEQCGLCGAVAERVDLPPEDRGGGGRRRQRRRSQSEWWVCCGQTGVRVGNCYCRSLLLTRWWGWRVHRIRG